MLTTSPHLRIRRPSPTTVEYTVSTSPTLTLPLRLLILLTSILRLVAALAILLLLYSKYLLSSYAPSPAPAPSTATRPSVLSEAYIYYVLGATMRTRIGTLISLLAARIPLILLLPSSGALLYLLSLRLHTTESLLVLRGLGIQTSSSSATYLSSSATRFIPTVKIQDVLVNEAFRGFEVRYYLVVVVEGEESVVVVFPRLLPRRDVVEKVWRGCRACLFEGAKEKGRLPVVDDDDDGAGGAGGGRGGGKGHLKKRETG
ncbi:hypothetical protein LZ554_009514 [Drepanopeziza brunnea f. sp. 'monogermtubi']|nr:hypothetical protein LZ554_009514 [Drepanopeziza brunnea f. sp. 'monogermtubi']